MESITEKGATKTSHKHVSTVTIYALIRKIPKNDDKLNLPTWYSPAHTLSWQIDYFIISAPRRNWAKTIKNDKIPSN